MKIDLAFPATASAEIAADHGYELFGALCRELPWLHEADGIGVHPVRGRQTGDRRLQLNDRSIVSLRILSEHIGDAMPLVGQTLNVGATELRLGAPRVMPLDPLPALRSRVVTIKGMLDPDTFHAAARRQLDAIGCLELVEATVVKRRTFRVRNREIVGFELIIEGLSPDESIAVQERGIGGRRHMGCGVFNPLR